MTGWHGERVKNLQNQPEMYVAGYQLSNDYLHLRSNSFFDGQTLNCSRALLISDLVAFIAVLKRLAILEISLFSLILLKYVLYNAN